MHINYNLCFFFQLSLAAKKNNSNIIKRAQNDPTIRRGVFVVALSTCHSLDRLMWLFVQARGVSLRKDEVIEKVKYDW